MITLQKPLFIALGLVIVFMTIYVLLGAFGWGAQASNEQAIGEISRWCERVSDGLFREPSNSLSNLGFMFAGLMMLRILAMDSDYLFDFDLLSDARASPMLVSAVMRHIHSKATVELR